MLLRLFAASILFCFAAAAQGPMMKDSPVRFPANGPLPAKYPPDIERPQETPEPGYFIFESPERSLAQINKILAEMPPGRFTPPVQDWANLRRTRKVLAEGGELHVLGLGDSIINDTMRSGWLAKLAEAHPRTRIRGTVYVRGGGGCQHYREQKRIERFVVPRKPDLVIIGGISQSASDYVRDCIRELRSDLWAVEILLVTGAFGSNADPRDPAGLAGAPFSPASLYGQSLKKFAREERCAFLDMTTPWAEYIVSSGLHPHLFYRDAVHANEYGEQILAKILLAFFANP